MNNVTLNLVKPILTSKQTIKVSLLFLLLLCSTLGMTADHRYEGKPRFDTLAFYNVLGQKKSFNYSQNVVPTRVSGTKNNSTYLPPRKYTKKSRSNTTKKGKNKYTNRTLVPVDFANIHIKKQELASMQAVSEACLVLLPQASHPKFKSVFTKQLKNLFPNIKNPKKAMRYLSKNKSYQRLLKKWKNKYSDKENRVLCNQMVKK